MVVIALIGIFSMMILPEMKGTFEETLLRSTARKLTSAANLASSQSILSGQRHRLRLDTGDGRFVVEKRARAEEGIGFVLVRDVPGTEGSLDERISVLIQPPAPVALAGEDDPAVALDAERPAGLPQSIGFYPDGTADSAEILLRDRDGFGLRLRVNPITSRIKAAALERRGAP